MVDRRLFLKGSVVGAAGIATLAALPANAKPILVNSQKIDIKNYTLLGKFDGWAVYENQAKRDGNITFVKGDEALILSKRLEACFDDVKPSYLGLNLKEICLADADLLADKLLASGDDPNPDMIRRAAPVLGWNFTPEGLYTRMAWTNFVGTRQQDDTMPVFPNGRTRGFRPEHEFPELSGDVNVKKRWEGLLGGWLPVVHKIIQISDTRHYDLMVFADVEAEDRFFVQTWHRTIQYENGKPVKTVYGHSFAPFPPRRTEPTAEDFYRALYRFTAYWHNELKDISFPTLPDTVLSDMVGNAFAKELITRPDGVYPKYGVVDRDYYGSEYDGFQDTFTSSLYANLEWGRFVQARAVIDNYFTEFVFDDGMINMRGPEVPQFGLTLSLLARYYNYTGDIATLKKYAPKIEATINILTELHDISLKKPQSDAGYGLIDGWSESDACLHKDPKVWWKPYWNNSAFAIRGWRDIARLAPIFSMFGNNTADNLNKRANILQVQLVKSMRANIRNDLKPPYIAILPGTKQTHRQGLAEAEAKKQSTEHLWAHRVYAETLHADVIPLDLANTMIDAVRGHGGTTIGVLANFGPANDTYRSQLGFISYGYAQQLLRADRIEEYLLFLYSHIYHSHTPGTWVAGEVSEIDGGLPLYCVPAQLTIPKLVRWMLVFEGSDDETLYLGKAIPREWLVADNEISIKKAPTKWGMVDFTIFGNKDGNIKGEFALNGKTPPENIHLKIRIPKGKKLASILLNGQAVKPKNDTIIFKPGNVSKFTFSAKFI